jgi:hypothetical protein
MNPAARIVCDRGAGVKVNQGITGSPFYSGASGGGRRDATGRIPRQAGLVHCEVRWTLRRLQRREESITADGETMKRAQWLPILERFTEPAVDCNWRIVCMGREGGPQWAAGRLMRPADPGRRRPDDASESSIAARPDEERSRLFVYSRYPRETVVVSDPGKSQGTHAGECFEVELMDVSNDDNLVFFWHESHPQFEKAKPHATWLTEFECAGTIAWEDIYRIEYKAAVRTRGA